jgi:hypothetical protein
MFSVRVVSHSWLVPLHDLAVWTLPRSHDMDMQATDLVGINGITRVLLVYTCQQSEYPRCQVLPLRQYVTSHPNYLKLLTCSITSFCHTTTQNAQGLSKKTLQF